MPKMISKKTTTTQTSRKKTARSDQPDAVPSGLVAAFTLIRPSDANELYPPLAAKQSYPYARKVIEMLHGPFDDEDDRAQDLALEETLSAATELRYNDMKADDVTNNAALRGEVAFEIGFAVCWLLMTQIHGGAR